MSAQILHFVPVNQAPNRIRELRRQVKPKLSMEALGQKIGVSKVTISDLERGCVALTLDYMQRIAQALGVTTADLLSQRDNPDGLSVEERKLLEQLRRASPEQREQVMKVADVIVPGAPVTEMDDFRARKSA